MKYISIPIFLLSFIIGMVYIYMSNPPTRSILIYKDKADNCFNFAAKEEKCPFNPGTLKTIPIQV